MDKATFVLTLITIGVALAAALIVAWQSWETRKSAQAAVKAVGTANEALKVALDEESNSRALLAEAVRLRIDTATPDFLIRIVDLQIMPYGLHRILRLPKDENITLYVLAQLLVINNSDVTADLHFEGPPNAVVHYDASDYGHEPPVSHPRIEADGSRKLFVHVSRPVREWSAIADWLTTVGDEEKMFRSEHDFDLHSHFYFSWSTVGETGASDRYHLKLTGSPLLKWVDEREAWQIAYPPWEMAAPLGLVDFPRERTYFLRRSSDLQLPAYPNDPRERLSDTHSKKDELT